VLAWGCAVAEAIDGGPERDGLEDLMVTSGRFYHVVREVHADGHHALLVYVCLDRARANLAAARRELAMLALSAREGGRPALPAGSSAAHRPTGHPSPAHPVPWPRAGGGAPPVAAPPGAPGHRPGSHPPSSPPSRPTPPVSQPARPPVAPPIIPSAGPPAGQSDSFRNPPARPPASAPPRRAPDPSPRRAPGPTTAPRTSPRWSLVPPQDDPPQPPPQEDRAQEPPQENPPQRPRPAARQPGPARRQGGERTGAQRTGTQRTGGEGAGTGRLEPDAKGSGDTAAGNPAPLPRRQAARPPPPLAHHEDTAPGLRAGSGRGWSDDVGTLRRLRAALGRLK
jgi:hypothetical protein